MFHKHLSRWTGENSIHQRNKRAYASLRREWPQIKADMKADIRDIWAENKTNMRDIWSDSPKEPVESEQ